MEFESSDALSYPKAVPFARDMGRMFNNGKRNDASAHTFMKAHTHTYTHDNTHVRFVFYCDEFIGVYVIFCLAHSKRQSYTSANARLLYVRLALFTDNDACSELGSSCEQQTHVQIRSGSTMASASVKPGRKHKGNCERQTHVQIRSGSTMASLFTDNELHFRGAP